jgi:hypothetical protein
MNNWYAIETEAAFRREEWTRAAAAEARAAQSQSTGAKLQFAGRPHLNLARLRSLTAPRLLFTSPLKPECRTAVCL